MAQNYTLSRVGVSEVDLFSAELETIKPIFDTILQLMDKESLLKRRAIEASGTAFAPHSDFKVGASLISDDGKVFSGSNVEPVVVSLGICAERNVIFQAIGAGHRKIAGIVIYTPTDEPILPCGACRELISEFGPDAEILSFTPTTEERNTIPDLLPKELV